MHPILIIPIGGSGQRYKEKGFFQPKPMVKLNGEPILTHVLRSIGAKSAIIACSEEVYASGITSAVGSNFDVICLDGPTTGASHTVYRMLKLLGYENSKRKLITFDCDNLYHPGILPEILPGPGAIVVQKMKDARYSYVEGDGYGNVLRMHEKKLFGDDACVGVYAFETCAQFAAAHEACNTPGEHYMSATVNKAIEQGARFSKVLTKTKVIPVGTPDQLYRAKLVDGKKMRFCFDLDGTLFEEGQDYGSQAPIARNIALLKRLHKKGHTIIIHTARRMRSHDGNPGRVIADIGRVTIEQLAAYQVPYHELHFGKPFAHHYIDDKAVNANLDLERELGMYERSVEPRSTNKVVMDKMWVSKVSSNPAEAVYYRTMPPELNGFFPAHIREKSDTIVMRRINGPTLHTMYANKELRPLQLREMLERLTDMHVLGAAKPVKPGALRWLTTAKLKERYNTHREAYANCEASDALFNMLTYATCGLGEGTNGYMHGDPVFTNILKPEEGYVFIDPRGIVDGEATHYGPVEYDLAKVLQSITGYDYVLAGKRPRHEYMLAMEDEFWSHVAQHYPHITKRTLFAIASCLYFSLIPLHQPELRPAFYDLAWQMQTRALL